ncbi:MAG: DUF1501 domain-containing protein [Verrucomicrobia bacterium]|nr:DUF1501 domain-containing protein [Verrucomicrobiota bacterium]
MNILTRRTFLERSLQVALGATASAFLNVPSFMQRALAQGTIPQRNKKILFVFLRGGNDGLNTIIPWGDSAYNQTTRPSLYIPPPDPLTSVSGRIPTTTDQTRTVDLGNGFAGIHPGLAGLAPVFNDGQVALIHRVGYPKQSRSHFDSQRYWENGMPSKNLTSSGIFYRAIANTGLAVGRKFPAISLESSNPLLLRGPAPLTTNLADPNRYDMYGITGTAAEKQKLLTLITAEYRIPYPEKDNRELLFQTGVGLKDAIDLIKTIGLTANNFFDTNGTTHLFPIDAASNQKGFTSSSYGYFKNIKTAAQVLSSTDAIIAGTSLGGFDTHNNQGALTGGHSDRMKWLGWTMYALRKYFTAVNPTLWDDTLVVTLSEFGRTTKENGNQGTDHAEAGVMFVAGGKVKGGVYQCSNDSWTVGTSGSMFQVNQRYLKRSVDYRSVLGEIIRDHLGATPAQLATVIPGYADARESLQNGGVTLDGTRIVGELGIV